MQILTSKTGVIASVVLLCVLGLLPFSYEFGVRLINQGSDFTTSGKILWSGLIVLVFFLVYCIFTRSRAIKLIDYILTINRGFSIVLICTIIFIFTFATAQKFGIGDATVSNWSQNVFIINNYLTQITQISRR